MKQTVRALVVVLMVMVSSVCGASVLTQEDKVALTEWAQTEFTQTSDTVKKYAKYSHKAAMKIAKFLLDTVDTIIAKPVSIDVHTMRMKEEIIEIFHVMQNELRTIGVTFVEEKQIISWQFANELNQMRNQPIDMIVNNCFMELDIATNNVLYIIEAQCSVEEKVTMLKNVRAALKEAISDCSFIADLYA